MALKFWLTHRYTNESLPDKRKDFNKYLGLREINKAYDFSADGMYESLDNQCPNNNLELKTL